MRSKNSNSFSSNSFLYFNASIFKLSASISTKTGWQPSQTIQLVVAIKERGVVIISPFTANAFIFICKAIVPLATNNR